MNWDAKRLKEKVTFGRASIIVLFLFLSTASFGTHLRAGEITVERKNCSSLTFSITITAYTNTGSEIRFGEGFLVFGDGSAPFITPRVENQLRPDLGPEVGLVQFTTTHTYSGPGRYVISYLEPNRNGGILNIFNSIETRFYIETVINIDPFLGCNNSPKLLVPPIDKACTGAAWTHNPGAYDPDGDSLSFEMTVPKRAKGEEVGNYRDPNSKEFYDKIGLPYATANEDGDGPPTFAINSKNGILTWDAPGINGEYNIAFIIKEWRKLNGVWVVMGYVVRDMQIIVEDCDNQHPELKVPQDICVEAGTIINQDIFAFDPDGDSVKIEGFSEIFGLSVSKGEMVPTPPVYLPSSPSLDAKVVFRWETKCEHIKEQPYQVVFKVTDSPPKGKGPHLVQFKTWNITVVGPAPTWKDATVDIPTRSSHLEWDPYTCNNATTMQIWRRVDAVDFTPTDCITGMPGFLGYTKLAEVPISQSSYSDHNDGNGLAPGAKYCYRLVAVFPLPGGGESYVSKDTCLAPILANAPIITNVSVDKTSTDEGEITIKWREPFDTDTIQFPKPYTYLLLRSSGITGHLNEKPAHTGVLTGMTYQDGALNTEELIYNYRVVAYDKNNVTVDTSFSASTVRLEAEPQLKKIQLTWVAEVPWSNKIASFPEHDIFRGAQTDPELNVKIDAVDVTKVGFSYLDEGKFEDTPLNDNQVYCYRVMTRGGYGNPEIDEPLINYSQVVCAQPDDKEAPCQPALAVEGQNCQDIIQSTGCGNNVFSNTLTWNRPADAACRNDIKSYNIYIADKVGTKFTKYKADVRDTFFIDTNQSLKSFARCYKISAVDRSGNESDLSEEYCFDNCPNYELPNVFTPNGDFCNELFSAFSDRTQIDENNVTNSCEGVVPNENELKLHCARFVLRVDFKVYNRWGGEVYSYQSADANGIYIDWDGRDNAGRELASGVYYYIATVNFDVVDPSEEEKIIRGWVHLIR